ncbi:tyrosine-type recombinase/integrase [Acidisoma silvae]|uniref:Tyrosine-type recombinase/integrase n=1 Tax=Acidisoma silvae TaxID=2802396 RepID=A0A963YVH0_9PROT|nr:site-specific integrase [Acidisoma silvae]MCB8877616.1 tyrosine-type recombinase/integrase [Acidisoma silvae]
MADRKRIGVREIKALQPNEEVWDATVTGFGARRQRSAAVAYVLLYRTKEGRQRRLTIGRHGAPWTPDEAREEAQRMLGVVAQGGDPAAVKKAKRSAATVTELCDLYLEEAEAGRILTRRGVAKKSTTLGTDRSRVTAHIKPLIGSMKVPAVTRQDVETFMHKIAEGESKVRKPTGKKRGLSNVRGGKGASSRTIGLLGAIFTFAVREGLRTDNPVRGVVRYADGQKERRLSDDEYRALGEGLVAGSDIWPPALAATWFLALTGWRSGEAIGLRWKDVDLTRRTATLPDTKTGTSMRPLSQAACNVLAAQDRKGADALVFPPSKGKGTMSGFPGFVARVAKLGELPADITPHVLRHSFASVAADLGYSEPTIAALIGHKGMTITSRYVHSADAVLLAAADKVAEKVAGMMVANQPNSKA